MNAVTAAAPASANGNSGHGSRDHAIVAWLHAEGPKTASEIAARFAIKQPQDAMVRLRANGLIETTGVKRLPAGATTGRPGAEYRALKRQPQASSTGARVDGATALSEAAGGLEGHTRDAAAASAAAEDAHELRRADERQDDADPAPATTAQEQLVLRYITALITTIERASILRTEPPPAHVFDRIERLLGIHDAAA